MSHKLKVDPFIYVYIFPIQVDHKKIIFDFPAVLNNAAFY